MREGEADNNRLIACDLTRQVDLYPLVLVAADRSLLVSAFCFSAC